MTPLRQWVLVRPILENPSVLWTPEPVLGDSRIGEVLAVGTGREMPRFTRPVSVMKGERVLYSSRVDRNRVDEAEFDVIEEDSIIGTWAETTQ